MSASAGGIQAQRGPQDPPGPADGLVSGPASAVYLFLWNRTGPAPAGVTISGDQSFLTSWQSSVRVRWG